MVACVATALASLRRTRRRRRLGDTEWFDVAYHVYLAAIFGGGAIVILSGYVGDAPLADAAADDVLRRAPAYLGLVVAVAIATGLRSGADGGPLSVELADVRHLLLAPISRRRVLVQPYVQRLRAVAGVAALGGGVAGLLAAQRLPGTATSWVLSGAAFGACVGAIAIAVAVHAHAVRLPGWVASAVGLALCGWQGWAAVGEHTGPLDTLGDLALWGARQHPVDLVGVGLVVAAAVLALIDVGRLQIEHLDRRGELVSQLRFAVTTQDLRTVVLLRRQLRQEQARQRPLVRVPLPATGADSAAVARGVRGLLRMPLTRLARIVVLGAGAGVAAGMAARGTTPAVLACGMLLFVMGLDVIEPLSQEIDHPGRTDDLPIDPGWLHLRLLAGPAAFAVLPALAGAVACAIVDPAATVPAFALAVPVTWAGMTGSVVNALRDDVIDDGADSVFVPPEVAGTKGVLLMLFPLIVSSLGTLAILAIRSNPAAATGAQMGVALIVYLAVFGWWVRKRADLKRGWNETKQQAMATQGSM